MHAIYYYLILNFNNEPALKLCVWCVGSSPLDRKHCDIDVTLGVLM